jgi:hypothetical protein
MSQSGFSEQVAAAKISLWGALGVAVITGTVSIVGTLIAKTGSSAPSDLCRLREDDVRKLADLRLDAMTRRMDWEKVSGEKQAKVVNDAYAAILVGRGAPFPGVFLDLDKEPTWHAMADADRKINEQLGRMLGTCPPSQRRSN